MSWNKTAAAAAALCLAFVVPAAHADSLSGVEGARAKDRAGRYISRHDASMLRRYGRDAYGGWGYGYRDYDYDYYGGPGIGIYIGPRSYGPYGY
jgi:hypothetical protein